MGMATIEWVDIRGDIKPKMMLVSRNGVEEESWPFVGDEEPEGSYRVDETGRLQRYESSLEDSEVEEEREQLLPEEEHYNLIMRRSFHATLEHKGSNQRENIFQTKCRIKN